MLPAIKLYNSMLRQKQPLEPYLPNQVKIYACGVTTYDDSHIGHAMQAIFFDVLRRYLVFRGYQVTYVRNYTDVDDKIIERAAELSLDPRVLSARIIESCERDFKALGVHPADVEPKVSESIPEIIAMIATLITSQAAYATRSGDVYYRVRGKTDYGKLSRRKIDELLSGTRALVEGDKEDPLDFALWKNDSTLGASWPSPWGTGRPGWHIECSAMAKKHLGAEIDIHGGGQDLIFPHHENEIAQSESANGCPYARVWMHSGLLSVNKQKMSKSLKNSITIADFLKRWPAEVLRLSYLSNHYRSPIDFSEALFAANRMKLLYYYETLAALGEFADIEPCQEHLQPAELKALVKEFHEGLSDDFNTPQAMAAINQLMRLLNQELSKKPSAARSELGSAALTLIRQWGEVLGLFLLEPSSMIATIKEQIIASLGISEGEILAEITARQTARTNKDWQESDALRARLEARGILLKDGPQGTTWTIVQRG